MFVISLIWNSIPFLLQLTGGSPSVCLLPLFVSEIKLCHIQTLKKRKWSLVACWRHTDYLYKVPAALHICCPTDFCHSSWRRSTSGMWSCSASRNASSQVNIMWVHNSFKCEKINKLIFKPCIYTFNQLQNSKEIFVDVSDLWKYPPLNVV